jgi:hypothetical protein
MCAARAAQDGQRRSHTRQPEKIPPHVLMQAWNTRRPLRSVHLLPFHRSIHGSGAVIAQSDIRCATQSQPRVQSRLHSHPRSCRLSGVLRGDAMPGQACRGGQERMSACASNIPVDRRNNATARSRKARKSSRTKSGRRGLASRLDSTRRRTLWVFSFPASDVVRVCANE